MHSEESRPPGARRAPFLTEEHGGLSSRAKWGTDALGIPGFLEKSAVAYCRHRAGLDVTYHRVGMTFVSPDQTPPRTRQTSQALAAPCLRAPPRVFRRARRAGKAPSGCARVTSSRDIISVMAQAYILRPGPSHHVCHHRSVPPCGAVQASLGTDREGPLPAFPRECRLTLVLHGYLCPRRKRH